MRLSARTFWLASLLVVMSLALSGCFQDAGQGAGLQPTQPGAAPLLRPSATPQLLATPFVEPTQEPSPFVFATVTPDVADGQGGMDVATATPVLFPSPTEGEAIGIGELALTATAVIGGQSATVVVPPTETPVVLIQPSPTLPQVTPLAAEMTATAMISLATQNASIAQTQVAEALGTYVPTATPSPTATIDPAIAALDCVHVVKRGETAFRIARQYSVSVDDIARANGLTNVSVLSVDQELVIPRCGNREATATPVPGVPTEVAPTTDAPTSTRTHTIQPGENLYRIALRYGVTMSALVNANGITNINVIKAGDQLVIPSR